MRENSSKFFPLSALPPNAVVHLPASEFIDLVEFIKRLEAKQDRLLSIIEKWGLTRQQIAAQTGRSVHTVGEWVRDGKMAAGRRHHLNENALTGLTSVADLNEFLSKFDNNSGASPQ